MKTLLLSVAAVLALIYQASAQVPLGPGAVTISKVEPQGVKTPEYQITGGPQKRSKVGTWLEIEVEFETKVEEIPELTFLYTIEIEKKLYTGTVTHVSIPKGRDHYSVMYISPRGLEKATGGKPLTGAQVWIEVKSADQVLLDAKATPKQMPIPTQLPRVNGVLLNKMETPFAPLFFDRYEAIKATRQ